MVDKYKNEFEIMKTRLKEIDFYLEEERDYSGTFGNGTDWKIVFWGERYTNIFDISIRNIKFKDDTFVSRIGFYLGYLNKLFNSDIINNMTFIQQLDFLIEYKNKIFDETFPYREAYDKLNGGPY